MNDTGVRQEVCKSKDMRIFKSFTFKWWEAGLFKIALVSFGIIIGSTWPSIFKRWRSVFLAAYILPGLYLAKLWWKQ